MNCFTYEIHCDKNYELIVNIFDEKIYVSCNCPRDIFKTERISEFSWGICLQNLVLFSLSIMNDMNFQVNNISFKKALSQLLNRIRQFEKLGDIELSNSVLNLFTCEIFNFIKVWLHFIETLNYSETSAVYFVLDNTIGLLTIFHILYFQTHIKL